MTRADDIVKNLGSRSTEDSLAILHAVEKKRKEDEYIKYWAATTAQSGIFSQFTEDIKIFGILGGNRSGKTELGAFIAAAWGLGRDYFLNEPSWEYIQHLPIPPPPNNIWVVGLDFPTLRDVIWGEKLRSGRNHPPLLPKNEAVVKRVSDSDFQIFLENGSIITGKSAESGREKFQSASVDLIWIDEEPNVDIFDECYQRTVDCRGKILLTLTPLVDIASGVNDPWVYDLYEDWKRGQSDVRFVQLSVLDNPYVPTEEKEKLLEKWRGHPQERARLYGEFYQRSGLVYHMWKPDVHMLAPFPVPKDWRRIVSIDPAATGTTAAIWAAISPRTDNIYLYREYYDKDAVVSDHARAMLLRNGGDPIDMWLIDPTWGRQRNAENHKQNYILYRDAGIPVQLAEVGEDFGINESREYVNASLFETSRHPKVYVFQEMHNFKYEIEHYVWDFFQKGDQKGQSKDKPRKRNDHLMNAFQYLCAMRPKGRSGTPKLTLEQRRAAARGNSYT